MQLRRTVFGFLVAVFGGAGVLSACATSVELGDEDEDLLEAGTGARTDSGARDGSATPPKGSSSGGSSGRSSSGSSSGDEESSSGNGGSSGSGNGSTSSGGSSSGGSSGMLGNGPMPGSACDIPDRVFTQGCGLCGKQTAKCLTGDAGTLVVGAYGACTGEVVNGCAPGSPAESDIACGFCGTQNRTCNNSCRWVTSSCTGEVTLAEKCTPGSTKLSNENCSNPSTFSTWTCNGPDAGALRCLWNIPGPAACGAPSFPILTVPAGTAEATRTVSTAEQSQRPRASYTANCSASASTTNAWGAITEIKNPSATVATIDIVLPDTTPNRDRMIAVYSTPPLSETLTRTCTKLNDDCSLAAYSSTSESCLASISVPGNGSIYLLSSDFPATPAEPYTLRIKRTP